MQTLDDLYQEAGLEASTITRLREASVAEAVGCRSWPFTATLTFDDWDVLDELCRRMKIFEDSLS